MDAIPFVLETEAPSLLGAMVGGLLATLTPCVYPLIPITLSIVGAGKEVPRWRALSRASLYCLGILISYALLGYIAVVSGSFFGSIWSSPAFRFAVGIAVTGYGLISLDLFYFRTNQSLSERASRLGGNSAFGATAAGAVSGILAAPCTGPLLATILTFAASNPNPTAGLYLLLAYASGFAAPFFILSLFPRALTLIPRSGNWLYGAKFLIASLLMALGFYYLSAGELLYSGNSEILDLLLITFSVIALSLCLKLGIKSYIKELRGLRLTAASVFAILLVPLVSKTLGLDNEVSSQPWGFNQSLQLAQNRQVPVIAEFTADWCVKCKELARDVLSKGEVIDALKSVEFTAIDLSNIDELEKTLQRKYGVRGLPAILFLCPSGKEMEVPRVNEVLSKQQFLERVAKAESFVGDCV